MSRIKAYARIYVYVSTLDAVVQAVSTRVTHTTRYSHLTFALILGSPLKLCLLVIVTRNLVGLVHEVSCCHRAPSRLRHMLDADQRHSWPITGCGAVLCGELEPNALQVPSSARTELKCPRQRYFRVCISLHCTDMQCLAEWHLLAHPNTYDSGAFEEEA